MVYAIASPRAVRKDARPKVRRLPRQIYPNAIERYYVKHLQAWFQRAFAEAYADVIEALPRYFPSEQPKQDAGPKARSDAAIGITALLEKARKKLKASLDLARFRKFLGDHSDRVEAWSKKEFDKQAKAALGVDLLTSNPQIIRRAKEFVATNVDLITTLTDDAATRVEKVVFASAQAGRLTKEVAQDIADAERISYRHAKLIARDQTSKLYGQLNVDRAKSAGLTEYIWRTSNDNAVRESHAALNGLKFRYDDPPEPGNPGDDYQCRCHAEPVFDTLLI